MRMVHQSQRLTLSLEPRDDLLGVHAEFDELNRPPAAGLERVVRLDRLLPFRLVRAFR